VPELHGRRFVEGGPTLPIPALASLIPAWHRDAACKDEPDERLFFTELSGATSKPHLADAALLLSQLICASCPVRQPCLAEGVVPLEVPGFARSGQFGRDVVTATEYPRRFGVWGGTSEYDRVQVRRLPLAEQAAELERTLPDRLAERIAAWKAVKGSPAKDGRPKNWTRRDRRIAAMLRARGASTGEGVSILRGDAPPDARRRPLLLRSLPGTCAQGAAGGVTVREYRDLVEGDLWPDYETWRRMCRLFGWPS
jgi:hypothetical protein